MKNKQELKFLLLIFRRCAFLRVYLERVSLWGLTLWCPYFCLSVGSDPLMSLLLSLCGVWPFDALTSVSLWGLTLWCPYFCLSVGSDTLMSLLLSLCGVWCFDVLTSVSLWHLDVLTSVSLPTDRVPLAFNSHSENRNCCWFVPGTLLKTST